MTGLLLLIMGCLLGAAFFAGMETGVISLNRLRLRHLVRRKTPGAEIIQAFLKQPDYLLGATLVGTNICHITISVLMVSLFNNWFGAAGLWLAGALSTLVILVFGEYLPKSWFAGFPAKRVMPFAGLLRFFGWLLAPVGLTITFLVKHLIPIKDEDAGEAPPFITREELQHLAQESHGSGALTRDEHRLIRNVFGLKTRTCGEIMAPREKMANVAYDADLGEVIELARNTGFTRFPVYNQDEKRFVGMVNVLDILKDADAEQKTLQNYIQHPQYCSINDPVEMILPRMRISNEPLMLVMSLRMEVVGVVTLTDVLDEIMGV